jgi:hypothetical protein
VTAAPFSASNMSGSSWPSSWEPVSEPEGPVWEPPTPADRFTASPGSGPWPPAPSGTSGTSGTSGADVAGWLDDQERCLVHPRVVEEGLRRAGWYPAPAAIEAARYRTRFNEHVLGYSALLVSTGLAALAAGSVGHALAAGIDHSVNRNSVAFWLTLLVVSLPFAIWAHVWAARVDRVDPVAVWSKSRRSLAQVLLWACGIVGIGRLAIYAAQLVGSLVGASWAVGNSVAAGAVNVAITISIALPLGLWAFHFRHRFDDEDPTTPRQQHQRRSQ